MLRATTACNFSSLIWPAGSAPAALASLLFDPPEPQIIAKTQCFATFLPFRDSPGGYGRLKNIEEIGGLGDPIIPLSSQYPMILSPYVGSKHGDYGLWMYMVYGHPSQMDTEMGMVRAPKTCTKRASRTSCPKSWWFCCTSLDNLTYIIKLIYNFYVFMSDLYVCKYVCYNRNWKS